MFTKILILAALMTSCGSMPDTSKTKEEDKASLLSTVVFSGYVSSGFSVSIDGDRWDDSEDYYMAQLEKMQSEAKAAGYDPKTVKFDADLGLNDLAHGMVAYVQADNGDGYSSNTYVGADGRFTVIFPKDAIGGLYRAKVVKRIGVSYSDLKGNKVEHCFNFYGVSSGVILASDTKPTIINDFSTKVTTYKCQKSNDSGINKVVKFEKAPADPVIDTQAVPVSDKPAVQEPVVVVK